MTTLSGAVAPDDFASLDSLLGTSGADTLIGTNGADTLDGGKGDDVIDGGFAADLIRGGAGADTLIWNPGGSSDTVDGGDGLDTLAFNGAPIDEVISLQAGVGGHAVLTRNVAAITMDVDNVERVAFRALAGADTFAIGDLTQTDIRQVDIDLGLLGGGGDAAADVVAVGGASTADRIVLTGKAGTVAVAGVGVALTITNGERDDRLAASTGSGDDRLDISQLNDGIGVSFDGGDGLDALVMDGTVGADTIALFGSLGQTGLPDSLDVSINTITSHADLLGVELLSVNAGDGDDDINARGLVSGATLDAQGGRGNDTLTGSFAMDTLDGGAGNDVIDGSFQADVMRGGAGDDSLFWNPGGGSDTVDGGADQDVLFFNGSNIGEEISLTAGLGGHAVLTRNVGAITMDVDNVERVSFRPILGADIFTIGDLTQTDIRQVDIDLGDTGGNGDVAADVVAVGGAATADRIVLTNKAGTVTVGGVGVALTITHAERADRLAASTGSGDDRLDISQLNDGIGVKFDGGDGLDTLVMDGTAAADSIVLFGSRGDVGLPDSLDVSINTITSHADLTGVELLSVNAGDGNDDITARNLVGSATLNADGGRGNDTLIGSSGMDTLNGGTGEDLIDGGFQADVMRGGAGNDSLFWNPGGGNDTVDGGADQDTLFFGGSNIGEEISLTAGLDGHAVLTRNVANITMDVDNVERVSFAILSGADHLTIGDLRATDIRQVDVNLAASIGGGDAAADVVAAGGSALADNIVLTTAAGTVSVTGVGVGLKITNAESADRFAADLGAGDDKVDISQLNGGIGLAFDGGDGLDTLTANGGDGADAFFLSGARGQDGAADALDIVANGLTSHVDSLGVETIAIGLGDGDDNIDARSLSSTSTLAVNGGRGNDTLTGSSSFDIIDGGDGDDRIDGGFGADVMRGGAGSDTLVWNPGGGSDTVDGGAGQDELQFNGSNIGEEISLTAGVDGHAVLTRNIGAITMDVDNVERVSFRALSGADHFTFGDLHTTEIRRVDVNLTATDGAGDGAADTISFTAGKLAGALGVQVAGFEGHATHLEADTIILNGFADHSFADAVAAHHIFQSGDGVTIADGTGLVVTLQNTTLASLGASDFLFS